MPTSAEITQYPVLNDSEAREVPPGPYCVYEISERAVLSRSTGTSASTEHVIESMLVSFMIHAHGTTRQSPKAIAIRLAEQVMSAFDNARFDLYPSKLISWSRESDFGVREDDEDYMWVVPYRLVLDKVVSRDVRRRTEVR